MTENFNANIKANKIENLVMALGHDAYDSSRTMSAQVDAKALCKELASVWGDPEKRDQTLAAVEKTKSFSTYTSMDYMHGSPRPQQITYSIPEKWAGAELVYVTKLPDCNKISVSAGIGCDDTEEIAKGNCLESAPNPSQHIKPKIEKH
jgi:hypothetical protein